MQARYIQSGLAALFAIQTLVLAFTLAWVVLAKSNFCYGIFHDYTGIAEGIERFGPKNRYKQGFGETSRQEHLRLFEQINLAVHNSGVGLASISYESPTSGGPQQMLREPEREHLQDVANLMDALKWVVLLNALLWMGLVAVYIFTKAFLLTFKGQALGLAVIGGASLLVILGFGPVEVFNKLHIWIFPGDHQWFFYYQDSLMSTLMLAPKLFGWIALALAILALPIFYGLTRFVLLLDITLNKPRDA